MRLERIRELSPVNWRDYVKAGVIFPNPTNHTLITFFYRVKLIVIFAFLGLPCLSFTPIWLEEQGDNRRWVRVPFCQPFLYIPCGFLPIDIGQELAVWCVHSPSFIHLFLGGELFDDLLLACQLLLHSGLLGSLRSGFLRVFAWLFHGGKVVGFEGGGSSGLEKVFEGGVELHVIEVGWIACFNDDSDVS